MKWNEEQSNSLNSKSSSESLKGGSLSGHRSILITGVAGFIGFHLAKRFLDRGNTVLGIDNLNDYYDVSLKEARLAQLSPCKNFCFYKIDITDRVAMEKLFRENQFDRVVHLAAQAGVRYSLENPHVYIQSNVVGFLNILEGCKQQRANSQCGALQHLIYASSSSVYGLNTKMPFSTQDNVDRPASLYGATKKADELMAHAYSHLYKIPTTGLRFFTVYGPWGRPDMALFKFAKAILEGDPIDVYNEGRMQRDFTYIDDIVEGVVRLSDHIPESGQNTVPYRIYNIGNHNPVSLKDFIQALEEALGKKAKVNLLPMQAGDVPATYADVDDLVCDVGFAPRTSIKEGIGKFVDWYRSYAGEK